MGSAFKLLQQEPLEVTAEYEDATGRKIEETFLVDFAAFENLSRVGEAPFAHNRKVDRETSEEHWESVEADGKGIENLVDQEISRLKCEIR